MRKPNRRWLVAVSLVVHATLVAVFTIATLWHVDRLSAERRTVSISQVEPMPEPSGSPSTAPKVEFTHKEVKHVVTTPVQPVEVPKETPPAAPADTIGNGSGNGSGDGSGSGTGSGSGSATGTCADPPCGDAPPQDKHDDVERVISPTILTGLRISGDPQIHPPEVVKVAIQRDGVDRVTGTFKLCVSASGQVASITPIKSTTYAGYDKRLVEGMRTWRYRPYVIDGRAVPVCSVVAFIYTMK
jgi:outer membrane biosynthesis protein TonB